MYYSIMMYICMLTERLHFNQTHNKTRDKLLLKIL